VLLVAGCWWRPAERYLFAVAAFVNAGWAATFLIDWVRYHTPGYWAPGIAYAGTSLAILVISSWPDPVARR
jgi:hypothetical protein